MYYEMGHIFQTIPPNKTHLYLKNKNYTTTDVFFWGSFKVYLRQHNYTSIRFLCSIHVGSFNCKIISLYYSILI